jgi:hypothetical protein
MSKRSARQLSSSDTRQVIAESESLKGLEQQVITIAEQLGRLAGMAHARTDRWLDQPRFHSQLARIRQRAARLLARLNTHAPINGDGAVSARMRSRAKVAAPGKKHRKAPEPTRGVKHSDEKITKVQTTRRRRTARPRQG